MNSVLFKANDRTIEQLKNSGGFQIFSNQNLADSIANYYKWCEVVEFNTTRGASSLDRLMEENRKIIDYSIISPANENFYKTDTYNTNHLSDTLPLLTYDVQTLKIYKNDILDFRAYLLNSLQGYITLQDVSSSQLRFLRAQLN